MAQLFLLSLLAFAIICTMYGISAGVQRIQHGCARLLGGFKPAAPMHTVARSAPAQQGCPAADAQPSPAQRCLEDLKNLYGLHQTGALSQEEFERLKQYLLSTITYPKQEAP